MCYDKADNRQTDDLLPRLDEDPRFSASASLDHAHIVDLSFNLKKSANSVSHVWLPDIVVTLLWKVTKDTLDRFMDTERYPQFMLVHSYYNEAGKLSGVLLSDSSWEVDSGKSGFIDMHRTSTYGIQDGWLKKDAPIKVEDSGRESRAQARVGQQQSALLR